MALLNTTHHGRVTTIGGTSYNVTIASTTAGSLLVYPVAWFQPNAGVITAISGGGTWVAGTIASGDANSHAQVWYAPNVSGGVTSLTVTITNVGDDFNTEGDVQEWSGMATATPKDIDVGNTGTSAAPLVVSGTLAQANEVLVGIALHTGADATWAVDTGGGYTQISENEDNDTGQTYSSQYKVVAVTTSDQADWTLGASRTWTARLVSFKEAAAGGTTMNPAQGPVVLTGTVSPLGFAINMPDEL